jgi:hypothetical protein
MPRTASIIDAVTFTVRLPSADAAWIAREGKAIGNTAIAVRRMVDDARNFYGMPEPIREVLAEDAKKRGKTQRDYVIELLTKRYEELLHAKFKAESKR